MLLLKEMLSKDNVTKYQSMTGYTTCTNHHDRRNKVISTTKLASTDTNKTIEKWVFSEGCCPQDIAMNKQKQMIMHSSLHCIENWDFQQTLMPFSISKGARWTKQDGLTTIQEQRLPLFKPLYVLNIFTVVKSTWAQLCSLLAFIDNIWTNCNVGGNRSTRRKPTVE